MDHNQLIRIFCEAHDFCKEFEHYTEWKLLQGTVFGDKGYIGKALFSQLLEKEFKLMTLTRKNMKPLAYFALEKQWLNQRSIIQTFTNHFTPLTRLAYTPPFRY